MELGDYDQTDDTDGADTVEPRSVLCLRRLVCVYLRHAHDKNESKE